MVVRRIIFVRSRKPRKLIHNICNPRRVFLLFSLHPHSTNFPFFLILLFLYFFVLIFIKSIQLHVSLLPSLPFRRKIPQQIPCRTPAAPRLASPCDSGSPGQAATTLSSHCHNNVDTLPQQCRHTATTTTSRNTFQQPPRNNVICE
ncbi:hypothetical protein VIGAN_07165100 [Vigna angularis var. angularis]|uniref:Uncharacterized protein n=1 Tax=Vigna angularis var. angularis TaxID=157739 RepID=A0A0S3SIW9_PHAAN|nr:hypothetical protein VIGAN_07165100 [Vigna angularis var. angularis]